MEQQKTCLRSNPPLEHLWGPLHAGHTEGQMERIQLTPGVLLDTLWHENFTWNLILRFYGWWQNRKIKIRKLYANLVYIITRSRKKDRERNWASVKLKSQQHFVQTIQRRTVKFNYRKVFVLYGMQIASKEDIHPNLFDFG